MSVIAADATTIRMTMLRIGRFSVMIEAGFAPFSRPWRTKGAASAMPAAVTITASRLASRNEMSDRIASTRAAMTRIWAAMKKTSQTPGGCGTLLPPAR